MFTQANDTRPLPIFEIEAPKYWKVGLPAIPLMVGQKRPAINRWQLFADINPTEEEQQVWLRNFAGGNIGMPMGPAANLVAVDIDTDDPEVIRVLEALLPKSPWSRVGKKGMVKVFRFTGERTTRIKHSDGSMICEILSKGTQIVLPPSIHPDTGKPYVANCNLYEVYNALPALPVGIEDLIRRALNHVGIDVSVGGSVANKVAAFVPAGARDNTMVWHAGLLARAVCRGERTLLQALGEMEHWVKSFVEQVVGDPLSVEKAQKKVVEFMVRDVTGERRFALPVGWDEGLTDEDRENLGLSFTDEDEKWPTSRILEYLAGEFERHPDHQSEGRVQAIQVGLDRIARADGSITALDEERVMRFIIAQSPGMVTIAALKRELAVKRRGDIAGESHDEVAQAVLKQINQYGEFRWWAGRFWQWKGAFWEEKDEDEIAKIIAQDFGFYPACRRNSDYTGVLKVMQKAAKKELSQLNIRGLNVANGFLTEDMQLLDHNEDHGMTYVLPYRYMPEAAGHMPLFSQYLHDSWGRDPDYMDKVAALQEAMGATLFSKAPAYQRAILLYGMAGSGKSVLVSIMRGMLPYKSVSSVAPHDWSDKFLPAEMFGKVLNVAGELSETRSIPGEIFKQVVVGEEMTVQRKNQQPFSFHPTAAQWFSSNHLPKTKDSSEGFNRRWLILEWNHKVGEGKKVIDLHQIILESEREAIVAWAAQGFSRLRDNRDYTLPASHERRVNDMSCRNNSVRNFLRSSGQLQVGSDIDGYTDLKVLHGFYESFCIRARIREREDIDGFRRLLEEIQHEFGFRIESNGDRREALCHHIVIE